MKGEPLELKDCTRDNCGMRLDVLSSREKASFMFARTSSWYTNDYNTFSTIVQVANQIVFGENFE